MRTTVTIDDDLYRLALESADAGMASDYLFREAIKVFICVQAGKRLAARGGGAPQMARSRRRRPSAKPGR